MRRGFKIFDSDTHLNPIAETLEPYFDAAMCQRLPDWESCRVPFRVGWAGEILQPPYRHQYRFKKKDGWRERLRILGEAGPRECIEFHFPKLMGSRFPTASGSGISDYLVRRLGQITSLRCRCFTCHYRYR